MVFFISQIYNRFAKIETDIYTFTKSIELIVLTPSTSTACLNWIFLTKWLLAHYQICDNLNRINRFRLINVAFKPKPTKLDCFYTLVWVCKHSFILNVHRGVLKKNDNLVITVIRKYPGVLYTAFIYLRFSSSRILMCTIP